MNIIERWTQSSLILKIFIGLIVGTILGIPVPEWQLIGFIIYVIQDSCETRINST